MKPTMPVAITTDGDGNDNGDGSRGNNNSRGEETLDEIRCTLFQVKVKSLNGGWHLNTGQFVYILCSVFEWYFLTLSILRWVQFLHAYGLGLPKV